MSTYAFTNGLLSDNLVAHSVTIASGASVSDIVCTEGRALVGIIMPTTWTAADLNYKAGDGTLYTVYDDAGSLVATKAAASRYIALPQGSPAFGPCLQLVSANTDGSGAAVAQGGARTLILIFRKYLS